MTIGGGVGGNACGGAIESEGSLTLTNVNFGAFLLPNEAEGGDGGSGDQGGDGGNGLGGAVAQLSGDLIADAIQALFNEAMGGNGGSGLLRVTGGGVGGNGGNGLGGGFYVGDNIQFTLTNSKVELNEALLGLGGLGGFGGKNGANGVGSGGGLWLGQLKKGSDDPGTTTLFDLASTNDNDIHGQFNP
jgi:hypothetical protein